MRACARVRECLITPALNIGYFAVAHMSIVRDVACYGQRARYPTDRETARERNVMEKRCSAY